MHRALVANYLDAVYARAVVAHKTPRAAARQVVVELEARAHAVFCLIQSAHVRAESFCPHNGAEEFLQQVYLVRREVVEIPAAGNVALHAPRQALAVVVEVARWHSEAHLHVYHLANGARGEQLLHLAEVGQLAAVVRHEAGHVRLLADAVDALAIQITAGERLLDIHRLAGFHGHDGIGGVRRRRCGDVYGVHLRVVYQLLRIGVPAGNAATAGVGLGLLLAAAHYGHHTGARYLLEGRTALFLGSFAATDEAPPDFFQVGSGLHKHEFSAKLRITVQFEA